ncbi:(d)CMP kinase [[Clostridium] polysaccharolyticum]|uniref:Cytidylate kinase n=1 Tax=[Clostridium] polysaccharolyticum TaxID=29364 RepID=A0A1I0ADB7_9FIRM|nr:(d)CMP kinase [[Clostridium] polysaccharolyticum]SES92064.1 cytidylate kinase [[Clostridium] polysaccharolyticum]
MSYSIAIDGPAGAGKSTIAKTIAKKLNFIYVDTGAMYRAIGLYFLRLGITDEAVIEERCKEASVSIQYEDGEQQVILNNENVNGYIRTEEAGKMASAVAKLKAVRSQLVELQRELAKTSNVIMDGRDIGTFVLPNADMKIYLTASSKVRADRRYQELILKGEKCDLLQIEEDIIARDKQDMNREFAPLRQADDAILVDSSEMSKDEVVEKIISLYNNVGKDGSFCGN